MKWITRKNIGIDRMACSWLIKKHVDPSAEFVFIEKGSDYKEMEGIPFDIPGAALSHKRGKCTFCTILKEYALNDKILDRIAEIVNSADTIDDLLPPPEAAGFDLICRGISRFLNDDSKVVEQACLIFESVYLHLVELNK
ncbi:MAG: hypothetical protein C0403_19820 [Desulfobacterium sp.]|nr:hypothetical protein [Desulfobacterium sp.]